jgi:putative acetyltransferase
MPIVVRPMRPDEARLFLGIHARSVRGIAAWHYPVEVLDAWTVPFTEDRIARFLENADDEIRLIAELDGHPAGIGALVVADGELRACYVAPFAVRRGVGTAIVREIERLATEHGLERLHLLASLNAEPFYAALDYVSDGLTQHTWSNGVSMAAVKMSKIFR